MPPHGKKFANHWHGSHPVQNRAKAVSRIGRPAVKQYTKDRHYALATVGVVNAYVTADGDYNNTLYFADSRAYAWMEDNNLVDRAPATRPGGAQALHRNADGQRVLAAWNAEHGEVDTSNHWDGDERAWEGC